MTKMTMVALGAAMTLAASASAQDQAPITATPTNALMIHKVDLQSSLPSNSEVWVSLDNAVDSRKLKMGEKFDVTVSRDVMMGDYVVIPRGTHGHGQISYRTGKGAFGKSAKMEFDIVDVTMADRSIPLSGHYRIEGQGNTGAAVGAVVAVGVLGAFVTGHSATASQGSEWKAATKEPILLAVGPAPAGPQMAAVAQPATIIPASAPLTPAANAGAVLTPAVAVVTNK